ncbi:hypothetical protein Vadar_020393 [Vaccinium darrowii]|uniref:Uncharacterized protein n=1 Tax=Vaccinium darrowii TaxID=229202 RepID=A0ACB7X2V2_9ERIC|nr:hypothetical protein Vadar_020393 [Vaccinium darrowii]
MGDPVRSPGGGTQNFHSVLGISKTASLIDISKAYKSLVMRWHPDKNSSNKDEAEAKFRAINEAYRALSTKKREEESNKFSDEPTTAPETSPLQTKSVDESFFSRFSRSASRRSHTPTPALKKSLSRNASRRNTTPPPALSRTTSTSSSGGPATPTSTPMTPKTPTTPTTPGPALSKVTSKRAPIIYSQSAAATRRKPPPPIEKKLECTLEELCHGCAKKIKITRDAISESGMIVQEEEILKIKIKPGWKKGTKITFEGKGDERPGTLPADIIFIIDEKRHPIFKREGDDLELGVEVPLVQALTGCTITVPLLGGEKMTLSFEDIIFPGYEKIIPGQGMPKSKEGGRRGDLRLKFLIDFPSELSDEQLSDVVSILNECS